jgi:cytochrome c oxidase subunit 1
MAPNPTPEYNFAVPPVVNSLDHFWHLKYEEDAEGRAVRVEDADEIVAANEHAQLNPAEPIHLPNPSYFPFFFALGLPLMFYGVIYHTSPMGKALIAVGLIVALAAVIGWAMEPLEEPHDEHDEDEALDEHGEPVAASLPVEEEASEPADD